MTYRERREARAERREEWAAGRKEKGAIAFDKAHSLRENIPLGQPILVDHYSAAGMRRDLERIDNGMRQGIAHYQKADEHVAAADEIRAQLDSSIYDDDPDALERIRERIAEMEADRDTVKAFNAAARKAKGDRAIVDTLVAALPDRRRADWESCAKHQAYAMPNWQFPSYTLAYISANIRRLEARIPRIESIRKNASLAEASPTGVNIGRNRHGYAIVTFAEKPSRDVINALKAADFLWTRGSWVGPFDAIPPMVLSIANA